MGTGDVRSPRHRVHDQLLQRADPGRPEDTWHGGGAQSVDTGEEQQLVPVPRGQAEGPQPRLPGRSDPGEGVLEARDTDQQAQHWRHGGRLEMAPSTEPAAAQAHQGGRRGRPPDWPGLPRRPHPPGDRARRAWRTIRRPDAPGLDLERPRETHRRGPRDLPQLLRGPR